MYMYNCKECNYQSKRKFDFNKHLKTKKHLINSKLINNTKLNNLINNEESVKFIKSCLFCSYKTNDNKKLDKHYKNCTKYQLFNYKKKVKRQQKKMIKLHKENEKLRQNQLKLIKDIQELKDHEIKCLRDDKLFIQTNLLNQNTKSQSNTNYIINNFSDAPDLVIPDHIENINNYLEYIDINEGYSQLLYDLWCKDIDNDKRSLWCVDLSRNKYLTKLNGNWKIDMFGHLFCQTVGSKLYNVVDKCIKEQQISTKRLTNEQKLNIDISEAIFKNNVLYKKELSVDSGKFFVLEMDK